ncbi:DUF1763-domain-containing protein [Melanomma pulvis-pyrius CBS 109.77]|uniref:DUF1763-domain-containing protein n=1 Tax=Melanomma pulvis-pyrius CBS 109.77 TaxID=1314802 RepID=A0A6A6XIJ8_9PLEO|nr:DUF1763-domain-containing protein [Melanomma pulvis-pyrius CBS 109.77]
MSRDEILHAYRHLYRHGLRAVQFSKPARYTLRDRLRLAFRKGTPADLNTHKIGNTIEFLHYATVENGLEHKILKNLLFVWRNQDRGGYKRVKTQKFSRDETEIKVTAFDTLNHNIRMLNESMGMCLPSMTARGPN